jgi:prevent-host-death family protein
MSTISHREMRNSSAEVLRRVEAGETFIVTNHGEPVAQLAPIQRTVLDDLESKGQVRRATGSVGDLAVLRRARLEAGETTADVIADLRGYDRGY